MSDEWCCVTAAINAEVLEEVREENVRLKDTIDSNVNKLAEKEAQVLRLQRLLLLSEQQRGQQMEAVREIAEQRDRVEGENADLLKRLDKAVRCAEEY